MLAFACWRFYEYARFRARIVPWPEDLAGRVEPGDHLLDWRRGERALRYCHHVDEAEQAELVAAAQGGDAQELLLIGHSVGCNWAVAVLARALARSPSTLGYYFTSDRRGVRAGELPAPIAPDAPPLPGLPAPFWPR